MKAKRIIGFISVPILCVIILLGAYKYRMEYAKAEVETYYSEDQYYKLVIFSIGEPVWPFGPGHYRFVLSMDNVVINELDFSQYNDGKRACAEDFSVSWEQNGVRVIVSGEEQEEMDYTLSYQ